MNNLTLADEDFTYYETLGGGQGACPDADGPSAIHVAMSNTLNTPVEALETEFPLRVRELSVRRGSGGDGRPIGRRRDRPRDRSAGPDALHPAHRAAPPPPARPRGGGDGATGRNLLNGEPLPSKARATSSRATGSESRRPAGVDRLEVRNSGVGS